MGRVYQDYCYEPGQVAVDLFNSNPSRFYGTSNAIAETHAHSDFGLYLHTYPLTNTNRTEQFSTEYLAACSTPGPLNQYTGTDTISNLADSYTVGWLIIAVFAAAWSLKVLRNAI